jgi:hypothetical protein
MFPIPPNEAPTKAPFRPNKSPPAAAPTIAFFILELTICFVCGSFKK